MRGPKREAYALSCTDPQWEQIKARAHRGGSRSAARHVVERSLAGLPAKRPRRLVLSEAEQRTLLERLENISRLLMGAAPGQEPLMASLNRRVGLLVETRMREMVRDGRSEELRALLVRLLGEREACQAMDWLEGRARGR